MEGGSNHSEYAGADEKSGRQHRSNDNAMPRLTSLAPLTAFLALVLTLAAAIFPSETFAQGGPPGGIIYY